MPFESAGPPPQEELASHPRDSYRCTSPYPSRSSSMSSASTTARPASPPRSGLPSRATLKLLPRVFPVSRFGLLGDDAVEVPARLAAGDGFQIVGPRRPPAEEDVDVRRCVDSVDEGGDLLADPDRERHWLVFEHAAAKSAQRQQNRQPTFAHVVEPGALGVFGAHAWRLRAGVLRRGQRLRVDNAAGHAASWRDPVASRLRPCLQNHSSSASSMMDWTVRSMLAAAVELTGRGRINPARDRFFALSCRGAPRVR